MNVALTGATGFIGRYIAKEFMKKGDTLRALVRPTSDVGFLKAGGARLVHGDFGVDESMKSLIHGVDVVIHNGYWHDKNELQEPVKWFELNVLSSLKLLEWCRQAGIPRFIFISTGAVYGRLLDPTKPRDENCGAYPRGGYAAYNRAVEVYVDAYRNEFNMLGSTSIRLCGRNVGIHPKLEWCAYLDIIRAALAGREIRVKGKDQFDCCTDIARNLRTLASRPLEKVEEVYCFSDDPYPMKDIAETIVRSLKSKSKVIEEACAEPFTPTSNARLRAAGGKYAGLKGIACYAREMAKILKP